MNWYEISVKSKADIAEELTTLFILNGIDDLLIEDQQAIYELEDSGITWDYIDEDLKDVPQDVIVYKAHYECREHEAEEMLKVIKEGLKEMELDVEDCTIKEIDPNDGIDKWKEYFKPFEICDGIVICPSWEEYHAKENERVLLMDPGSAFGTGTHETTALCASFINDYVKGGEKVIDIGCGSGILSIISLFKGAEIVRAVDVDELAINATIENAEKNDLSDKIEVALADEDYGRDYDIILSNLTSPILIDLADRIEKASKEGTYLLCSGILTVGKSDVIEVYEKLGFQLIEDKALGEWTGLVFKK